MENVQTGEITRAGSTCGARMAGWAKKEVEQKLKAHKKELFEKMQAEIKQLPEVIELWKVVAECEKKEEAAWENLKRFDCDSPEWHEAKKIAYEVGKSRLIIVQPYSSKAHEATERVREKYKGQI
jgi:hypothetical protein